MMLKKTQMPRHLSAKAIQARDYIHKKAHKIRKEHPGMPYKTAVSKAAAHYRAHKKGK